MASLLFVTHPEVVVDPAVPIERWQLSHKSIERMRAFLRSPVCADVPETWASGEMKAIEAAGILAGVLGLGMQVSQNLGENDRSATDFLPPTDFEAIADAFFSEPNTSTRGWERAIDAQARVRFGNAISRNFDQPSGTLVESCPAKPSANERLDSDCTR